MAQWTRHSPTHDPNTDLHPEDFERLVELGSRYPEEVVNRAFTRAIPEARRRLLHHGSQSSTRSDNTPNPSQSEGRTGSSSRSSPQVKHGDNPRLSITSTVSSYRHPSPQQDPGRTAFLVPSAPGEGRSRYVAADSNFEASGNLSDGTARSLPMSDVSGTVSDHLRRRHEPAKNYVCTYCNKDFGGKSDWKRHETTFHEPQYVWHCPVCNRSFNSKRKFSTHHARDHDCNDCEHAAEAQKMLPNKAAFGCGFQMCTEVLYSWDERCNHVAKHFEDGESKSSWHYSNIIRNLLMQVELKDLWYRMLSDLYGPYEMWPQLQWRLADTRELKEQLEYGGFGNVSELLQEAHKTGIAGAIVDQSPANISDLVGEAVSKQNLLSGESFDEPMSDRPQSISMRGAVIQDQPVCTPDMYPINAMANTTMQFYQSTSAPGSVDGFIAPTFQGVNSLYQQPLDYREHNNYNVSQPITFPPVATHNILASDVYFSSRPIPHAQQQSLPQQSQDAASPPKMASEETRRQARQKKSILGKRTNGLPCKTSSRDEVGLDDGLASPFLFDSVEIGLPIQRHITEEYI